MTVEILHGIAGARKAEGLVVVIDVFRAFSLECYLFSRGVREIFPVGTVEAARQMKKENPEFVLVGERGGVMCEGFDFGNSPAQTAKADLKGKRVIHTTSAGTQGLENARQAQELLAAGLVNAKATVQYIKAKAPGRVSLVCMGKAGTEPTPEDTLCGEYIRSLLTDEPLDIAGRSGELRQTAGAPYFDPEQQGVYPEGDFWMCIDYDRFPYVLRAEENMGKRTVRMVLIGKENDNEARISGNKYKNV